MFGVVWIERWNCFGKGKNKKAKINEVLVMTQYIVTGASGFVGKNLVLELEKKEKNFIYAVVRNEDSDISMIRTLKNVRILFCTLNNIKTLYDILKKENIRSFFHLAWEGSTGVRRSDYELQMKNIIYSVKAFEVAEQLHCEKFLCAGTVSENITNQIYKLEIISQNMIYALAKKMTYDLLNIVSQNSSLKLVWMQFSNIYGPGNKSGNLISYTFRELMNGKVPKFGPALQPYNFIYIADLIQAICCLEKAVLADNRYFLGSGEVMLLKDYLIQIPAILGINCEMGIGERPDDGVIFEQDWFDITTLKQETTFQEKYTFNEGIRETYEKETSKII